jgi:signal transduction histidine kinase
MIAFIFDSIIAFYIILATPNIKNKFFVIIGLGFAGSAIVDFVHAISSLEHIGSMRLLPYFIPQTWAIGRLLDSGLLVLGLLVYHKNDEFMTSQLLSTFRKKIIVIMGIVIFVSLIISHFYELPGLILSNSIVARPYDLLALMIFSLGLVLFYKKKLYDLKNPFYKGILLFLIISTAAELLQISTVRLYVTTFTVAHILKITSYFVILLSIVISNVRYTKSILDEVKDRKFSDIGALSARIAHDIRNPLSVIKNANDLMKMKNQNVDEQTRENFKRIDNSVFRITHQIDDVLDYVRTSPLDLGIHELSDIVKSTMAKVKIPSNVAVKDMIGSDIRLECDFCKIEVVFTNLLINAIQAIGEKEGSITIEAIQKKDKVIVEVKDSGSGISPEHLSRIFEPLFTTKSMGTGLGLLSCKNIVEQHGGEINLKSELGKGTTFILYLPTHS